MVKIERQYTHSTINLSLNNFKQSGQWQLVLPPTLELLNEDNSINLNINLELRRNPSFYVLVLLVPNICLTLLSFLLFFLPFAGGEKVATGVSLFLAVVMELMVVSNVLPPTGRDDLPIVAKMLVILVSLIFLSVFAAVVLSAVHCKRSAMSKTWSTFLGSQPVQFLFGGSNQEATKPAEKLESKEPHASDALSTSIHADPSWQQLANVLNHICFLIYCGSIILTSLLFMFEVL